MMRPVIQMVFWGLIVGAMALLAFTAPGLPDPVFAGFNADGSPRGTMSKAAFVILQVGLMIGLPIALSYAVPAWLHKLPDSMINMPHREYWLAPARRAHSLERIGLWLQVQAAALTAFLMVVYLSSLESQRSAALTVAKGMDNTLFLSGLAAFLTATGLIVVGVYRSFPRPPNPV